MNILETINSNIDLKYKKFHERICFTKYEILGIKIPILRKIAKDLLQQHNYIDILNSLHNNIYEHIMLKGLVIANAKITYQEKIDLIESFMPLIDNWGICDIFCGELKFIKINQEIFFSWLMPFFKNPNEYYLRFAIVILLNYYIDDGYIDFVLEKTLTIKSDYYYVKMALAWCLSICLIKYFDKTIEFLNNNKMLFDKWTYNKALQKGIESLRISKENKKTLQNMKLK